MRLFLTAQHPLARLAQRLGAILALLLPAACAVPPPAPRTEIGMPIPAQFKQAGADWSPAASADLRGPDAAWWELFDDEPLSRLIGQLQLSNQNIAAALAAHAQAQALVRQQSAALFPSATVAGRATRAKGAGDSGGTGDSGAASRQSARATLDLDWSPDPWGRLRSGLANAQAQAQGSEAELAGIRLSAQAALASAYFELRAADGQIAAFEAALQGYERSVQIVRNRYAAGLVTPTDLLQAQTERANAAAELLALRQKRERLEHALAVLTGRAPADFTLPRAPWPGPLPEVPAGLPSALLQSRPDIAAAERAVAAANAQIGVRRSAFFPNLRLTASVGGAGSGLAELLQAPGTLWSIGLTLAQPLFDAGANAARLDEAQAARDAQIARYRQKVLGAFQEVEDQLSALHTLQAQEPLRQEALAAAERIAQQQLNRYRNAQIGYTEVLSAQASALVAQRSLLQWQLDRRLALLGLIQALGGGWQRPWPAE